MEKKVAHLWVEGFDPNKYDVPIKLLPVHPYARNAEMRQVDDTLLN